MWGWDFRFDGLHSTAAARDEDAGGGDACGHASNTDTLGKATVCGQAHRTPFTTDFDTRVAAARARVKEIARARTCTLQRVAAEAEQLIHDSGGGGDPASGEL